MKSKKYQVGIQGAVRHVILQSKRMDLPYITKQQIINEIKKIIPGMKYPNEKIGQALYQLQRPKKYRRVEIRKIGYNRYTTAPQYTHDIYGGRGFS